MSARDQLGARHAASLDFSATARRLAGADGAVYASWVPKLPERAPADENADVQTRKLSVPADPGEARDQRASSASHSTVPAPSPTSVTTRMRTSDIEELLKERAKSGTRPAVSEEARERFERREMRETVPAPADAAELHEEILHVVAAKNR